MTDENAYEEGYNLGEEETQRAIAYSLCPVQYGLGICTMGCATEPVSDLPTPLGRTRI